MKFHGIHEKTEILEFFMKIGKTHGLGGKWQKWDFRGQTISWGKQSRGESNGENPIFYPFLSKIPKIPLLTKTPEKHGF